MFDQIWNSFLLKIASYVNKRVGTSLVETKSGVKTYGDGRETTDSPYRRYYGDTRISAKDKLDHAWNMAYLDERRLPFMKTTDLLKVLMETSPDFNRALHDFVQFTITDYDFAVHDPSADPNLRQSDAGTNQSAVTTNGMAIINEALMVMKEKNESFTVKLEKAAASIFLHGAIFSEVVLDLQGRNFSDFVIVDATLAEFQPTNDPVDGEIYRLGQYKDGEFIDLHEDPTIDYIAFDAIAGSPIGRSLSSSSIFPLIFSLMILKDLRQVIRTQGYPFKFATIDREKLSAAGITDKDEQQEIIDQECDKLQSFLEQSAGPYTDTPITGAEMDIKIIEGIRGSGLSGIETLIQIIDRQIIRALKTYSVIFGINSSSGLSDNSSVQSELHYLFIGSIQKKLQSWIESAFTEILRARGNPGIVEFKLERVNTLVSKERALIAKEEAQALAIYVKEGAMSAQEMRDALRHPDPFGEMAKILPQELPPDAQRQPDEVIEVDEEEEGTDE